MKIVQMVVSHNDIIVVATVKVADQILVIY